MPKGKKTCEKCGHQCGPRAYMCPECQHPFMFAPQSKEKKTTRMIRKLDWRELQKGDKIKADCIGNIKEKISPKNITITVSYFKKHG